MADLYYPTIDLYVYGLIDNLGESQKIGEKQAQLIDKIPQNLRQKLLPFPQESTNFYYLFKEKYIQDNSADFERFWMPVSLGDSYGLLFDCSVNNKYKSYSYDIILEKLAREIPENLTSTLSSLGHTYLISAALSPKPSDRNQAVENTLILELAKNCYHSLSIGLGNQEADWESDFDGNGYFLGANIFELSINTSFKNQHIIIILYPDLEVLDIGQGKFYETWLKLFFYYHKIISCHQEASRLKAELKTSYGNVNEILSLIDSNNELNLQASNKALSRTRKVFNDYYTYLPALQFQAHTIEINAFNYNEGKKIIEKEAREINHVATDLKFLDAFSDRVRDKYLFQIRKDTEGFNIGLKLLENTIGYMRTELQVEKATREKSFQEFVTTVGTAVAVTAAINKGLENISTLMFPPSDREHPAPTPWGSVSLICLSLISIFFFASVMRKLLPFLMDRNRNNE